MNSVVLIGRLTSDPQSHAGERHESATFRLAVPRSGSDAGFVAAGTSTVSQGRWSLGGRGRSLPSPVEGGDG